MWRASLTLFVLAACNGRLGLDDVAVDDDRDGVDDTSDNCADTANPDQEDWDADGIGDACDTCEAPLGVDTDSDGMDDGCDGCVGPGRVKIDAPNGIDIGCQPCMFATGDDLDHDNIDDACDTCLRGDEHDEDGDGVADACDVCPTRGDPAQEQVEDLDRLGDNCDPDSDPYDDMLPTPADQSPRIFDSFRDDSARWEPGNWTYADDRATLPALSARQALYPVGLYHLVETVVELEPGAGGSFTLTLHGVTPPPCLSFCVTSQTDCTLSSDGTLALSSLDGARVEELGVDTSGPVRLWFRSRAGVNGHDQLCVAEHGNGVTRVKRGAMNTTLQAFAHDLTLTAGATSVTLDYLWLVAN